MTRPEVLVDSSVSGMLARIEKMNQTNAWFRPRTMEEINVLVPEIRQIGQGLFADNCLGALHGAPQLPRTAAWWETYNLAYLKAKNGANKAGIEAFGTASWAIIEAAARTAGLATACLTRADPSGKVSPHSIIWTLYEMGAAGVYFLPVSYGLIEGAPSPSLPSTEMLRIHLPVTICHPVANVDCTYFACLVSSPSGEGDSKVSYIHSVTNHKGCPQTRLLDPDSPILVQ